MIDYAAEIDSCDSLIEMAKETIVKADKVGAKWLSQAAEREIVWATKKRDGFYKKLVEGNGRYV
jgi:hypothetical protein